MEQTTLFSKNTIQQINIYNTAAKTESRTDVATVKLTPSQIVAIRAICKEHGGSVSKFIADALEAHIELFPYREKLLRHKDLLISLLGNMA